MAAAKEASPRTKTRASDGKASWFETRCCATLLTMRVKDHGASTNPSRFSLVPRPSQFSAVEAK